MNSVITLELALFIHVITEYVIPSTFLLKINVNSLVIN